MLCDTRRINLYPVGGQAPTKVPHAPARAEGGSKEDGTHLKLGIFQPCHFTVTHPPWIGVFLS
jgi:hypothetical protein